MGFTTIIDILGSMAIGSMLFLILLRMNNVSTENIYTYGGELQVQENLVSVVELIEYDFRKIGYCKDYTKIPNPATSIILADSNRIAFRTDVNDDGIVDTLRYFLGSANELQMTPNPRDRILYRVVNSETPRGSNLGVTQFSLRYFDALGNILSFPITTPAQISSMEINVTVENTAAYDQNYSSAFWRQIRLAARNLKNR